MGYKYLSLNEQEYNQLFEELDQRIKKQEYRLQATIVQFSALFFPMSEIEQALKPKKDVATRVLDEIFGEEDSLEEIAEVGPLKEIELDVDTKLTAADILYKSAEMQKNYLAEIYLERARVSWNLYHQSTHEDDKMLHAYYLYHSTMEALKFNPEIEVRNNFDMGSMIARTKDSTHVKGDILFRTDEDIEALEIALNTVKGFKEKFGRYALQEIMFMVEELNENNLEAFSESSIDE